MDFLAIEERIMRRIREIGMTKEEFYKRSGISSASFSQWHTLKYEPSTRKLLSAAEALKVSYQWLTTGVGEKYEVDTEAEEALQELRDVDRVLLEVTGDMTVDEVKMLTEFARTIKNANRGR